MQTQEKSEDRQTEGSTDMKRVTHEDYMSFAGTRDSVTIEDSTIPIGKTWRIESYGPPPDYKIEHDTVWSFPNRGEWATHKGDYRGNWSPYIPRNLILKYTAPADLVLDQMVGGGTTLVECKLLGRCGIGVDINPDAVMLTRDRLNFPFAQLTTESAEVKIDTYIGDARNLDAIPEESVDLISTHPPYSSIIGYGAQKIEGDISRLPFHEYLKAMEEIAGESMRVLKPGKYCAILIGDTRKRKHYVPIAFRVLQQFLEVGFILKEDVIKIQWKTKTTREKWRGSGYDFYLIAHEHLFIFRKPSSGEKSSEFRNSTKWWD